MKIAKLDFVKEPAEQQLFDGTTPNVTNTKSKPSAKVQDLKKFLIMFPGLISIASAGKSSWEKGRDEARAEKISLWAAVEHF